MAEETHPTHHEIFLRDQEVRSYVVRSCYEAIHKLDEILSETNNLIRNFSEIFKPSSKTSYYETLLKFFTIKALLSEFIYNRTGVKNLYMYMEDLIEKYNVSVSCLPSKELYWIEKKISLSGIYPLSKVAEILKSYIEDYIESLCLKNSVPDQVYKILRPLLIFKLLDETFEKEITQIAIEHRFFEYFKKFVKC